MNTLTLHIFDYLDDESNFENPQIDAPFQFFYAGDNGNTGWAGYFICNTATTSNQAPSGSIQLGTIGEIDYNYKGFIAVTFPIYSFITGTNWVPIDVPYMNVGNGDWDAEVYGDLQKLTITEVDGFSAVTNNTSSTNTTSSSSFNLGLSAKIGQKQGTTPTVGFTFGNSVVKSTQRQFMVTADRIDQLGTVSLQYQDNPSPGDFPYFLSWGFGWNFPQRFWHGSSSNNARKIDIAQVQFIDLIGN